MLMEFSENFIEEKNLHAWEGEIAMRQLEHMLERKLERCACTCSLKLCLS